MKNTATRARSRFAGIVVILLLATRAHAEPIRTPVTDARPVLLAIYIDVSTVKRYRETGCSRLKVLFWQAGLKLPDVAVPRKQTIEFGINYCLDGLPPKSLL